MEPNGQQHLIPVWTIGTEESKGRALERLTPPGEGITAERLGDLRDALSAFIDSPLVTLEAHPMPAAARITGGRLLDAASPLAQNLTSLLQHTGRAVGPESGETLFRMVIPAKVAAQLGSGAARSMPSSVAAGGVYSGILGSAGIVGQATFVPVAANASGAAAAGAGGAAAVGGGAALVTVAAPFVLLAVAAAATVYAEEQRRKALEQINTTLLELKQADLDAARDALAGSVAAIDTATSLLLDEAPLGHSIGLGSAVHQIDKAVAAASRRATDWQRTLGGLGKSGVPVNRLKEAFPGIEREGGEFVAHLRMASFAIAMKRRVAVLQAVEHKQMAPELTLPRFASALQQEQEGIDDLERRLTGFLLELAAVELRPPTGVLEGLFTRGEVSRLLEWSPRLRKIAEEEAPARLDPGTSLEMGLIRSQEGKVRVLALAPAS